MVREPICPQCDEILGDYIPAAIEDPIRVRCPTCEMIYTFHRNESESSVEENQYYFSAGPFRKNPMQMDARDPSGETTVMNRACLLYFCIIGSLLLFGILSLIDIIVRFFGWF